MQSEIEENYNKIQNLLIKLIPENWESIYLYASIVRWKKGEMFFYYFPKKIIKTKPINCYEIPNKFGINENEFNKSLENLYGYFQEIHKFMEPKWTNLTIEMTHEIFKIKYNYNNIENSQYSDEERRIVWRAKYLNIPTESMSLKEKTLVETYNDGAKIKPTIVNQKIKIKKNTVTAESSEAKNQILKY